MTDQLSCGTCGTSGPPEAFNSVRTRTRPLCRRCHRYGQRVRRGVHPVDAALQPSPSDVCAICRADGGERGLMLDHDHATGRFRGWLCSGCNLAIAHLSAPEHLRAAIAYLGGFPEPGDEPGDEPAP